MSYPESKKKFDKSYDSAGRATGIRDLVEDAIGSAYNRGYNDGQHDLREESKAIAATPEPLNQKYYADQQIAGQACDNSRPKLFP